jgi:DNA invertase Pin-like site-specific DNA recombinase
MTKLQTANQTKPTAIVIYARVSRAGNRKAVKETLANDVSLAAQTDAGRRYAAMHDLEIVEEIREVESGRKVSNRKLFQRALKLCKQHQAILHVWSLSRAFRSVRDAFDISEQLAQWNCDLVSTSDSIDTSSAMGRAYYGILNVINSLEAEIASERIINSLNHKRVRGEWLGSEIPYGYVLSVNGVNLIPVKKEIKVLEMMIKLRNPPSQLSYARIAERLNRKGIPAKKGGKWHGRVVNRILTRYAKEQELAA